MSAASCKQTSHSPSFSSKPHLTHASWNVSQICPSAILKHSKEVGPLTIINNVLFFFFFFLMFKDKNFRPQLDQHKSSDQVQKYFVDGDATLSIDDYFHRNEG